MTIDRQIVLLHDELLRKDSFAYFGAVMQELLNAGLAPDKWFVQGKNYLLKGWRFERKPGCWNATTESHPIPLLQANIFNEQYKGLHFEKDGVQRCSITTPETFRAFVSFLCRIFPETTVPPPAT